VDEKAVYIDTPKENDQQKHHLIGGLWLEDSNELNEADAELLKEVAASYGLCFAHLKLSAQKTSYFSGGKARKYKLIATLIAIMAFCFPVQLKITAPAEVISDKPFIISAPFDGLLDNVYVEPGQTIKKGDRLASMDKTELEARFETVEQELKIAQAAYAKTGLEALRNSERKADLRGLQADINARKTALKHAEIFLERSDIIAERDGIAIFSDQSTLINRPFRAGEKIMTIADQESAALLVRVPAQALLPVKEGTEFSFHLNPEPLTNRSARLNVIGYEPSQDSDGLLTYKLRAEIDEDDRDAVRIGWQGTANVPSKRSILGYAVLRRPLIALRDMIGL
jgi:multidrug efflux pump subunit AcrA (membrane-fusion protein)